MSLRRIQSSDYLIVQPTNQKKCIKLTSSSLDLCSQPNKKLFDEKISSKIANWKNLKNKGLPKTISLTAINLKDQSKSQADKYIKKSLKDVHQIHDLIKVHTPQLFDRYLNLVKPPVPKNKTKPPKVNIRKSNTKPSFKPFSGINLQQCIDSVAMSANIYQISNINPKKKLLILATEQHLFKLFLNLFMEDLSCNYNIALWFSDPGREAFAACKYLESTFKNKNFRVNFALDNSSILNMQHPKFGALQVKPLKVIYNRFSYFNHKNTIVVDNNVHSSFLNRREFIILTETQPERVENELDKLYKFLMGLANVEDLSKLSFLNWKTKINTLKRDSKMPPPGVPKLLL